MSTARGFDRIPNRADHVRTIDRSSEDYAMNVCLRLPDHWTPQQADFLHEIIDQLHNALWAQYGDALCRFWAEEDERCQLLFADRDENLDPTTSLVPNPKTGR